MFQTKTKVEWEETLKEANLISKVYLTLGSRLFTVPMSVMMVNTVVMERAARAGIHYTKSIFTKQWRFFEVLRTFFLGGSIRFSELSCAMLCAGGKFFKKQAKKALLGIFWENFQPKMYVVKLYQRRTLWKNLATRVKSGVFTPVV